MVSYTHQSLDPNFKKAQEARLAEYQAQRSAGAFDKSKTVEEKKVTQQTIKSKGDPFLTADYTGHTEESMAKLKTDQDKQPEQPVPVPQQTTQGAPQEGFTGQAGETPPQEANVLSGKAGTFERDYSRETQALTKLGVTPETMRNMNPRKLFEMTYTPEELEGIADYQKILEYENAKQTMEGTPAPTNTMLAGLEDALRKINDPGKQQIGVSDLYKQAGIPTEGASGYATLSQAMGSQSRIMNDKHKSFVNQMTSTAGAMKDTYQAVAYKYELQLDEYNKVTETYQSVVKETFKMQQEVELAEKQMALENEAVRMAWENPTPETIMDLREKGYTIENGELVALPGEGSVGSSIQLGDTSGLESMFTLPGGSRYRDSGWECAEGHNRLTDGAHLPSIYYPKDGQPGKMSFVTKRDNAQSGNGLVIPWGSEKYGHAATVLQQDGKMIYTQEWNHNGDGRMTFESYNIDDLNKKYGEGWGFTDSTWKPEYEAKLNGMYGESEKIEDMEFDSSPDWFQTYVSDYYPSYSESEMRTLIKNRTDLSKEEKLSYVALFDRIINESGSERPEGASAYMKDFFGIGDDTYGLSYKELKERDGGTKSTTKEETPQLSLSDFYSTG